MFRAAVLANTGPSLRAHARPAGVRVHVAACKWTNYSQLRNTAENTSFSFPSPSLVPRIPSELHNNIRADAMRWALKRSRTTDI